MLPRSCQPKVGPSARFTTDSTLRINDEQWALIAPFFLQKSPSPLGGRPERDHRACFDGILWGLITGARWKDLPAEYPAYCTCWRRLRQWTESGAFLNAWAVLLKHLDQLHQIDLSTLIGDGTFAPCKKGGDEVGLTKIGKGSKVLQLTEANGLPIAVQIHSASPAEVKRIPSLVRARLRKTARSKRVLYDKAADSAQLREQIRWQGLRLIALYRKRRNEIRARKLHSRDRKYYKLRYRVERCFTWMTHFRRLNVR